MADSHGPPGGSEMKCQNSKCSTSLSRKVIKKNRINHCFLELMMKVSRA